MVRLGTMRNGVIVPDEPDSIPEGSRVRYKLLQNPSEENSAMQAGVRGNTIQHRDDGTRKSPASCYQLSTRRPRRGRRN